MTALESLVMNLEPSRRYRWRDLVDSLRIHTDKIKAGENALKHEKILFKALEFDENMRLIKDAQIPQDRDPEIVFKELVLQYFIKATRFRYEDEIREAIQGRYTLVAVAIEAFREAAFACIEETVDKVLREMPEFPASVDIWTPREKKIFGMSADLADALKLVQRMLPITRK